MKSNKMNMYRLNKNLSMKELSFKTGISERYLYFIEKGEKIPSMKIAQKISIVLGNSIEEIFFNSIQN